MKYSLKNEYAELLKEEIASIKSKSTEFEEKLYSVRFDNSRQNISGKALTVGTEDQSKIDICQQFTTEPANKLLDFVKKKEKWGKDRQKQHGIRLRMEVGNKSIDDICNRLNKYFSETIKWKPNTRKKTGRGEVSVNLAFYTYTDGVEGYSSTLHKEPDFVAPRNIGSSDLVKYSIKSFTKANDLKPTQDQLDKGEDPGSSAGGAQTGTNFSDEVVAVLEEFQNKIFNGTPFSSVLSVNFEHLEGSSKTYTSDRFKEAIKYFVEMKETREEKENLILEAEALLLKLKNAIIVEHKAMGIIAIDRSNTFIPIKPGEGNRLYITNFSGSRIGFQIHKTPSTFQNKLEQLRSEVSIRETYIHSSKKAIISEGGKAGHMMHPYENLHLKISDMKEMIRDFQNDFEISEKVDGANLFFTINPDSGELLFSRNKSDMTREETLEKFGPSHPAHILFTEGANSIYNAAKAALSRKDTREIFGKGPEGGKTYINFEIMHPKKPNQIKYDMKYIVFHSIVDFDINGSKVSSSADDPRLLALISKLNPYFATQDNDFNLGSNFKVKLNTLSDSDIEELMSELNKITSRLNLSDDMTIADAVKSEIVSLLDKNNLTEMLSEEKIEMIYDFITNESSTVTGNIIKKDLDKEIKKSLVGLGLTSKTKAYKIIKNITKEFRPLFILLGIKLLHNIPSRYMSSEASSKNVDELRRLLNAALEDYDNLVNLENPSDIESKLINTLSLHVANIRSHGIERSVSSPIEGGVFIGKDGNTYKVTGGFAPLNQILGTAMRNLDNMPIFEREFDLQERRS